MRRSPSVSALFVHPLKGAMPVQVTRLDLDHMGAFGDRRWMLVDADDVAVTSRTALRLARIRATLPMKDAAIASETTLSLSADGLPDITVDGADSHAPLRTVTIWNDTIQMADAGDTAAQWCSDAIQSTCRLVHMSTLTCRPLATKYAGPLEPTGRTVAVTDGAPLLLLGASSIEALNARLRRTRSTRLSVERFRPNVLLSGTSPNEEDLWARIRIGNVEIGVGSQCPRCPVTTLDPATLERGVEPLRTLASYRRGADGGAMMGMNATHAAPGTIHVNDQVSVLSVERV